MKKIFKKNQIIITALAVMIAAAGYISYSDAQIKGKKDKTAKTETASETETSVNMDQVLQDMENLDLDVTDETGAATASDGTDATASGEESSGTESQTQETPGEAVLTGASTYMAQARIEREQIRSQNKESLLSIINNEALSETERESAIASMVNMTDLVEKAMPQILAELDPHSTYIPAQNLEEVNSELEGSFSGIGIQFTIQNDTIHVNAVIQGGPSEKVGLMAGDRIVTVDDSLFVGKKVTNERAMRTLKGPKGSQVKLGVKRMGEKDLLSFTITRGDIPQNTVDAAYMLNDEIGYVKVSKFGRTSHVELLNALAQLNHKKCKGLIIDLRGNTGGYMEAAIRMVNEFLPEGKLIVYTQGRKYPRAEEFANGTGSCQKMPLVVLIDEGSASASEIFTGAIQDNDRGTVVGRRSFGKGLVQQPIDFSDGSAIRLTIARYYTPAGRCIQRPYESGKDRNYELDLFNRYEHGEFFSRDSIKQNENELYYTSLGRPVYGGGGIMPDIFVPQDTTGVTSYLSTAINRD